jgi:DnaK suppressor protein
VTDTAIRHADVRRTLSERRRELQDDVQSRILDRPTDRPTEVFALRIRAETLTRIDEALLRLDAGKYGSCLECGREISERRLRALPFAVRCQVCEEK